MKIWKFGPLTSDDGVTTGYGPRHFVEMPRGATIIHVGPDASGALHVWAAVNPDSVPVERRLAVFATGDLVTAPVDLGKHVGSALLPSGLMFHVFDEGAP